MQAVAAEQNLDGYSREPRRAVDSTALDAATRDYLRGQVSLEAYTRLFDEFIDAVECRQRAQASRLASERAAERIAQRFKHVLDAVRMIGHAQERP